MKLTKLEVQPAVTRFRHVADGIEVRHIQIHRTGTLIPQHSHEFSHLTTVAYGAIQVTLNGVDKGIYKAPSAIEIPAGTKHVFRSLVDDTMITCTHNISRSGEIEVREEHQLVEGD